MKKKLSGILSALLIISLGLTGCGSTGEDGEGSTVPGNTDTDEVYTITFASWLPAEDNKNSICRESYFRYLEEASGGRLKFEPYYSETLCSAEDCLLAMQQGLCNMTEIYSGYFNDKFPLTEVFLLPFENSTYPNEIFSTAKIINIMYDEFPEMREEWAKEGATLLFSHTDSSTNLSSDKEVRTADDLKGMIIFGNTELERKCLDALGATSTFVTPTELYDSYTKGILDGVMGGYTGAFLNAYLMECDYCLELAMTRSIWNVVIDTEFLESLPQDLQDLLLGEKATTFMTELFGYQFYCDDLNFKASAADTLTSYTLTDEELEAWKETVAFAAQDWVAKANAAGYDGQRILDRYRELVEEYGMAEPDRSYLDQLNEWGYVTVPEYFAEYVN